MVVVLQAAIFLPLAVLRPIDGDEGAYVTASTLAVEHGRVPYVDFLYTQTPLLPYVYGTWIRVLGETWFVARSLSVICAIAVGALLYVHLARRFGNRLGLVGVGLYVTSGLVFEWFVTVKTYALSTLLLLGAYVLVERAKPRWTHLAVGGVLLGLAIDVRLLFAAVLPAFAWAAARSSHPSRARALGWLGGGLVMGLAPSLLFLARDPGRFLFDVLEYHGTKSGGGLVGNLDEKLAIAASLLGVETRSRPYPQFLLLVVCGLATVLVARELGRRMPLALLIAACLGAASLLPTPGYAQYFAVVVPFLIVGVIELVDAVRGRLHSANRHALLVLRPLLVAALGTYVALGAIDYVRLARSSPLDRPGAAADVAAFVDAHTTPGEEVVAGWPGHLFGTHAVPVPGLESDFAPPAAAAVSPAAARRYRLASVEDVERMIREHRTRLVVAKTWNNVLPPVPDYVGTAEDSGYRLLTDLNSASIYGR